MCHLRHTLLSMHLNWVSRSTKSICSWNTVVVAICIITVAVSIIGMNHLRGLQYARVVVWLLLLNNVVARVSTLWRTCSDTVTIIHVYFINCSSISSWGMIHIILDNGRDMMLDRSIRGIIHIAVVMLIMNADSGCWSKTSRAGRVIIILRLLLLVLLINHFIEI